MALAWCLVPLLDLLLISSMFTDIVLFIVLKQLNFSIAEMIYDRETLAIGNCAMFYILCS